MQYNIISAGIMDKLFSHNIVPEDVYCESTTTPVESSTHSTVGAGNATTTHTNSAESPRSTSRKPGVTMAVGRTGGGCGAHIHHMNTHTTTLSL